MAKVDELSVPTAAPRRPSPGGGWPAVATVAAGTFTVVTSEMLPVGLLTPISGSLYVSEGTAGLTLTVTGLIAAFSAPLITAAVGRTDRRTVLCSLLLLLAAANALAAWSPDFAVMMAARVLVGVGLGGVWSLAGGLAVLVAVAMAVLLPPLPAEEAVALGGVLRLFGNARVATGLAVVFLLVTGHFAAYTYVRPILEDVSGVGASLIGALLLAYGIAGIAGNFAAGARVGRSLRGTVLVIGVTLTASLPLVPLLGLSPAGAAILLVVWGLAYGGVSVSTQTWLGLAAPKAREGATSLFVSVFNGAIALGAFTGGRMVDGFGTRSVLWLGGALALGGLVVTLLGRVPAADAGGS
jgi:predicted MFS family arabinose efflux permease